MASRPYEDHVVRCACVNLWGLTLVCTSVVHRQGRRKSADAVTNKPSAM